MGKSAYMSIYTLSSNICLLKKTYPEFLRILQETNFDMGFQKINIRDRYEKAVVFVGCVSQTVAFE
jgi:hypothetical protein